MQIFAFCKKLIAQLMLLTSGKNNGPVKFFFSHGSNHSRGVAIFVRKSLDFKVKSSQVDVEGRYFILEATI